ncbi:MAG: glutamate 5-kinase [Chloroflexi bacterium]|nr:glutamate 5-kinase [Chloroflexota bacterium]
MSNTDDRIVSHDYKRIVVKAGTSLLTGGTGKLDTAVISNIVSQICDLQNQGKEITLVSSGAVAAGREVLGKFTLDKDVHLDKQVLAAIGQGRLIQIYEEMFFSNKMLSAQALVSRRDVHDRLGYLNLRNTLLELLKNNVVPVVNENDVVALEELTGKVFGDNDTLSALVANSIDADLLIILGKINGLYTKDPTLHKDAEIISVVEKMNQNILSYAGPSSDDFGRGGMVTKLDAARLATASGVDVVMASGYEDNGLIKIINGENVGTLFRATTTKLESRKRWMLSGIDLNTKKLVIKIDTGAKDALIKGSSLLPSGVISCYGEFSRGSIVAITTENDESIGVGITNYSKSDISEIQSLNSSDIKKMLGYYYGDEIIHRDNFVLLD